jgi:predicted metal-binding protein
MRPKNSCFKLFTDQQQKLDSRSVNIYAFESCENCEFSVFTGLVVKHLAL